MNNPNQYDSPLIQLQRLANEPGERETLQSDVELLTLYVERGCRQSIEALIRRYAPMVASVCRLTVADAQAAEDAFQVTFLVLLKSAKKIRRQASVAAWLHGVAYRSAARLRKQRLKPINLRGEQVVNQRLECNDPVQHLARQMELETLNRELENLPELIRVPLIEHYLLGHNTSQIAERLEVSVSAIEGRLRRGRRRLRLLLARRGISLGILVSGSVLFQRTVESSESAAWTDNFVAQQLDGAAGQSPAASRSSQAARGQPVRPNALSVHSSLVYQELNMSNALIGKSLIAVCVLLVAGGMTLYATAQVGPAWGDVYRRGETADAAGTERSIETANIARLSAELDSHPIVAQFQVAETEQSSGSSDAASRPSPAASSTASGPGAGQDQAATGLPPAQAARLTTPWQRPDGNEMPVWLAGGQASMTAMDDNRAQLANEIQYEFISTPLEQVAEYLTDNTGTLFELNLVELDLMGIAPDTPVTIQGSSSIRELLRRTLEPHVLTYRVTESTIEITSEDAAHRQPSLRCYDLAYILPNASHTDSLVNTIQQSIDPDYWLSAGGTASITVVGSMMVVSAADTTHQQLEILLINLSRMNPKNAEQTPNPPAASTMGGMVESGGMF